MKAIINKASDWDFERVEKDFSFSREDFKRLEKEFGCSDFVVSFKSMATVNNKCDVEITIYDTYIE